MHIGYAKHIASWKCQTNRYLAMELGWKDLWDYTFDVLYKRKQLFPPKKEKPNGNEKKEKEKEKEDALLPNENPQIWYGRFKAIKRIWVQLVDVVHWLHKNRFCHLVNPPHLLLARSLCGSQDQKTKTNKKPKTKGFITRKHHGFENQRKRQRPETKNKTNRFWTR